MAMNILPVISRFTLKCYRLDFRTFVSMRATHRGEGSPMHALVCITAIILERLRSTSFHIFTYFFSCYYFYRHQALPWHGGNGIKSCTINVYMSRKLNVNSFHSSRSSFVLLSPRSNRSVFSSDFAFFFVRLVNAICHALHIVPLYLHRISHLIE